MATIQKFYRSEASWTDTDPITNYREQTLVCRCGGQIYMKENVTVTPIVTIDVAEKILGTTTFDANLMIGFDTGAIPASNKMRYIDPVKRQFLINAEICGSTATNNRTFRAQIFKNGALYDAGTSITDYQIAARKNEMSINCRIELVENDVIEVYIANVDDTNDPTIDTFSLCITEI